MVTVDEHDDRVVVTLNRPEKRNAIDAAMVEELHRVCAELERQPRLLLLTGGTDGIFAAGADIAQLRERGKLDALAGINSGLFARIRALPLPTVAAIDGPALGGGAELGHPCDLRVCTHRAVFGQPAPPRAVDLVSQAVLFEDSEKHRRMTEFLSAGRKDSGQGPHRSPSR